MPNLHNGPSPSRVRPHEGVGFSPFFGFCQVKKSRRYFSSIASGDLVEELTDEVLAAGWRNAGRGL